MPKLTLPIRSRTAFTIIEVMIVLVVAAAILLIVFLAVPALQRNSRNTQYRNEANRILALAEEFTGNNRGRYPCFEASDSRCNNATPLPSWGDFETNYLSPNGLGPSSNPPRSYYAYTTAYNGVNSDYFLTGSFKPGTIVYWAGAVCTNSNLLDPVPDNSPVHIAVWVKFSDTSGYCVTNGQKI